MPGKYIEFIKAGRYAVPVELTFLPSKVTESNGKEVNTSKWMERRHWKETKAMLKPAVESALKHNEMTIVRVNNTHIVTFGQEICLGYMLQATKDNAPFLAVLDAKKNCWTDDEDEVDEYSVLNDYGGRFKNYAPTKVHIIACVLKKTISDSEDNKRLRKELGVRSDDLRSYFQQSSTNANNPGPSTSSSSYDCYNQGYTESSNDKTSCTNLLSSFDAYCAKANMKKSRYTRKSKDYVKPCVTASSWKSAIPSTRRQEEFWNRPYRDSKYDDDTLDSDDASSDGSSDASTDSNVFEKRVSSETNDADDDDDDDFSLPDIDSPIKPAPVKKPRVYKRKNVVSTISPKRSVNVNAYEKDVFGSSDSSSASKSPRKKKQAPLTYLGFSKPISQSFEEAISTTTYRNSVTKKANTNSLTTYSKPKVSKKVQKATTPTEIRSRKTMPTTSSPAKKNSSSYQTNDFSHPSVPSESYLRKMQTASIGDSNYRSGSYFYPPIKHSDNMGFMNKEFSSATMKSPSSVTSSPIIEETSNRDSTSNYIHGIDRVLTVAAKKSFGDSESPDDDKQRKRKASSSSDITSAHTAKIKKSKHKDKDRILESSHKGTTEGRSRENKNMLENGSQYDPEMPVLDKMVDSDLPDSIPFNIFAPRLSAPYSSKPNSTERGSETASHKPNSTPTQSSTYSFMYSPISQSTAISPSKSCTTPQTTMSAELESEVSKKAKKKKHKDKEKKRRKMDKTEGVVHSEIAAVKLKKKKASSPEIDLPDIIATNPFLAREYPSKEISAVKTSVASSSKTNVEQKETERFKHLKTINSQLIRHKDACTSTTADAKLDEVVIELLRQNAVINYEVDAPENNDPRGKDTTIYMTEYDDKTGEEQVKSVVQLNSQKRHNSLQYSDDDEEFFDKTIVPLCASQSIERSFHMPAFGPTDDYADKDLFCFNKNSTSKSGSFSVPTITNNKVSQATNTDDEEAISMPPPTKRPPRSPKKPIDSSLMSRPGSNAKINENSSVTLKSKDSSKSQKQLSTYELLTHPTVFKQGMGYLQKLSTNRISAQEVNERLGIADPNVEKEANDQSLMPPPKPKRDLSPDICCLTPDTKINQIRNSVKTASNRQSRARNRRGTVGSTADGLDGELPVKIEAESDVEDNAGQELVRELMSRCTQNIDDQHEDSGDDHNDNLSQRSNCMTNFVPGYVQKSAIYKKHSKIIQAMTVADLVENFDAIRGEIKGIYEGIVSSTRHSLYLQGLAKKKLLKELKISLPFTSQQGMFLISLLYDFLFPDPEERLQFTEYITFVMLPETYIRIYAKVTDQTYDMAQLEMRFGACYDESTLEQS